jgi:pimeloyl-ACP methyl ester carboxylesterase
VTSVALIPGAGGLGWYWHLVERDLRDRGYDAFAVDLAALGRTGLPAYADAVVEAIDGRHDVALVTQSMGAFTAPLVWQHTPTWPPVPIHVVAGRDDRFFPLELQQRVARERLGIDPVIVPGGHLAALSHPGELAAVIAGCLGPA